MQLGIFFLKCHIPNQDIIYQIIPQKEGSAFCYVTTTDHSCYNQIISHYHSASLLHNESQSALIVTQSHVFMC